MTKLAPQDTIAFIGTYPPRECGIGTFTYDLLHAFKLLTGFSVNYQVAALNASTEDAYAYPEEVTWQIDQENSEHYRMLAQDVNANSEIKAVIVQHEYGIFGSNCGRNILEFLKNCKKPVVLCLHTVLEDMSDDMRDTTLAILENVDRAVVLTNTSRNILVEKFPAYQEKISVIEHGIHPSVFTLPNKNKLKHRLKDKLVLTTFGLLSRGKGIEYVISALPELVKDYPNLIYLVLGQTHPVERRREGEKYRLELMELTNKLGLTNHVKFYDRFLDLKDILSYLSATDLYVATSLNPHQAVSGTLSYALGAGRAVVTTEFKQAKEVVDMNVGRVVPVKDSQSYYLALKELLSDHKKLLDMHKCAYEKTRLMLYTNVAHNYLSLLLDIVDFSANPLLPVYSLKHLHRMTDDFGLLQFAKYSFPDPEYGYTLDDNVRALIICKNSLENQIETKVAMRLANKYIRFMFHCLQDNGSVINYLNYLDLNPTEQNASENIEDSVGRAIWALSEVINSSVFNDSFKRKASLLFMDISPQLRNLKSARSIAFAIKGLSLFGDKYKDQIVFLADNLVTRYLKHTRKNWRWFEEMLTYCNGVLPEALLCAYEVTSDDNYKEIALESLNFLISKTFMGDVYVPIGQKGWHKRGEMRSQFDQQPEDPFAMIQVLTKAYNLTGDHFYKHKAYKCFSWFLGNNLLGQRVYNDNTGGCHDALTQQGISLNQGAESLVSYLGSFLEIYRLDANN